MDEKRVAVAVVYALPDRQSLVKVTVPQGSTVADAVVASGLLQRHEISPESLNCAVYGRVVPTTQTVVEGDRIEILRPLVVDPKEQRRQIAARARRK